jgi:uncharacterized protein (DUF488 family)
VNDLSLQARGVKILEVPEILTIGHSTQTGEEFLAALDSAEIKLLADVRRYPGSRRVPWTNSAELDALLDTRSIGYRHFEGLGGRRRPSKSLGERGLEERSVPWLCRSHGDH